ncbi:MAG: ornithine cyclodeaminase family protein [Acidobacteria bacterium]|nr:ornithine cyclodeaminase family protein [Acidobacteriota bacterium]NIM61725.1 ornithine cyclodeaminase family protein [Acidobacteriota bacterium]NIO58905.1 ornithine cyclodeaminase family protein [Acidobacteriota bacterium]NIQ29959.1 ornithine cyclodeaminase family protein [Acidobacteriota bacterium]NIQ84692.1 ornithine cyclodeaminase family protein [Acidobacteriota bacterium]
MQTVILTAKEVRQLMPMADCMEWVAGALEKYSTGRSVNPLRRGVLIPDGRGLVVLMPGYLSQPEALGLKAVTIFHGNHGTELDSHQGVVVLFDTQTGVPTAILDASEVTAIRTAAASGVATRLLARADADTLAVLGSGVQARTHIEAMLVARPVTIVRVYSPNRENRERLATWFRRRTDATVDAVDTAREAVEGASIVCTTTSAKEPVVEGEWLSPGTHINAVGACIPKARELDDAAVAKARMFVDSRESAMNESGDFLLAREAGAIGDDAIEGEIGELLAGRIDGRRTDGEITLFNSLGIAVEDLATAHHVLARALEQDVGARVALGGLRDAGD